MLNFKKKLTNWFKAKIMFFSFINLIFHYWRRSFLQIFLVFILPLIIFLIVANFFDSRTFFPANLASVSLINGLVSMSLIYSDFKRTIIKKLQTTPLPFEKFILSLIVFNIIVSFFANIIFFIIGYIYTKYTIFKRPSSIQLEIKIWWLFLTIFLSSISSSLAGFMIGILSKSTIQAFNISLTAYLTIVFLAKMYLPHSLPIQIIDKKNVVEYLFKFLEYASFFSTFTSLFVFSIFESNDDLKKEMLYKPKEIWLPLIIIFIMIFILFFLNYLFFKKIKH